MKMNRLSGKGRMLRVVSAAAVLIAGLLAAVPVGAAKEFPDITKNGSCSITVNFTDNTGAAVGGNEITLYKVADVAENEGYFFRKTADFAGSTTDVSEKAPLGASAAEELRAYAEGRSVSGTPYTVPADGRLQITNLDLGLYLLVETRNVENYMPISPFLVTIPIEQPDGTYSYTVDASAKPTTRYHYAPVTMACPSIEKACYVGENSFSVLHDPVTNTWTFVYPSSATFTFNFERTDSSYPWPEGYRDSEYFTGENGNTLSFTRQNKGTIELGNITFPAAGTYEYRITELNERDANNTATRFWEYDNSVYYLVYRVTENSAKTGYDVACEVTRTTTDNFENRNGEVVGSETAVFTFDNEYTRTIPGPPGDFGEDEPGSSKTGYTPTPTPTGTATVTPSATPSEGTSIPPTRRPSTTPSPTSTPRTSTTVRRTSTTSRTTLPQTGQLWWPIWVLCPAGLLLVLIGLRLRRRDG